MKLKCRANIYCLGIIVTIAFLTVLMLVVAKRNRKNTAPPYRTWGYESAPITVEVFTDLECPACARAHGKLTKMKQKYSGKFKVIFRHYPLLMHRWSLRAAVYGECAGKQNMFGEYVDELFMHQENWVDLDNADAYFTALAENLGLDIAKLDLCVNLDTGLKEINKDIEQAIRKNVDATPTFMVNGVKRVGMDKFELEFLRQIKKYEY